MPTHDFNDIGDVLGFELLKGTITALDTAEDTCIVTVGGQTVNALLFYHCQPDSIMRDNGAIEGAAAGFSEGDEVIVLKKNDGSSIKVIGHTDGIRRCEEDEPVITPYYVFYLDGTTPKIANCKYDSIIEVINTKSDAEIYHVTGSKPITFHCKRFTHDVPTGGVTVARDLYFVATNLYINPVPYPGWDNFATANPTHPMVTNNTNTRITKTAQVTADLLAVNTAVNNGHDYLGDGLTDTWKILADGEAGDCEDFALTKAQRLLDLGYPASALHIEIGIIDGSMDCHAWLVVQTTTGDYTLNIGSNAVVRNELATHGGTDYISRRRQIGLKWAFISPYGWLFSSSLTDYTIFYILDPLLNIFHEIPSTHFADSNYAGRSGGVPFVGAEQQIMGLVPDFMNKNWNTVNFSETEIYISKRSTLTPTITPVIKYRLDENVLTYISQTSYPGMGFVDKNGGIVGFESDGDPGPNVSSANGYYDVELLSWNHEAYLQHILSRTLESSFRIKYQGGSGGIPLTANYHLPNGEIIPASQPTSHHINCWTQIDTDDLLIQAVKIDYNLGTNNFRMYKDGVSCLDTVANAVGVTKDKILGLVYVPAANRLNGD